LTSVSPDFATQFDVPPDRCARLARLASTHLPADTPVRLLDIGCGSGGLVFELARQLPNATVIGVDVSPVNVERAISETPGSAADRVRFVPADYMSVTFEPCDMIIAYSSLQYFAVDDVSLFTKIAAELRPRGLLICAMPVDTLRNRCVERARRTLRRVRTTSLEDSLLRAALLVGRRHSEAFIRQRLPYLTVKTHRFHGDRLDAVLSAHAGLQLAEVLPDPQPSVLRMPHEVRIYRRARGAEGT
jgi:trans-aconitate methyltransferase